ncbi:hypothetical protein HXA32_19005 [Salipaludibacillus agaradhaerens]|uniref:hypothetical protein n=1 Tax=Salipaludibacillus agaradhaerens TaxID=76935 RepID=UPI002150EE78|nr:hypothetical protein [Salipaludibacillus agaradhaerens]MCR6108366.1 hypothetical protein [Salipaludibacillus agaradhaerens]
MVSLLRTTVCEGYQWQGRNRFLNSVRKKACLMPVKIDGNDDVAGVSILAEMGCMTL